MFAAHGAKPETLGPIKNHGLVFTAHGAEPEMLGLKVE